MTIEKTHCKIIQENKVVWGVFNLICNQGNAEHIDINIPSSANFT